MRISALVQVQLRILFEHDRSLPLSYHAKYVLLVLHLGSLTLLASDFR